MRGHLPRSARRHSLSRSLERMDADVVPPPYPPVDVRPCLEAGTSARPEEVMRGRYQLEWPPARAVEERSSS